MLPATKLLNASVLLRLPEVRNGVLVSAERAIVTHVNVDAAEAKLMVAFGPVQVLIQPEESSAGRRTECRAGAETADSREGLQVTIEVQQGGASEVEARRRRLIRVSGWFWFSRLNTSLLCDTSVDEKERVTFNRKLLFRAIRARVEP